MFTTPAAAERPYTVAVLPLTTSTFSTLSSKPNPASGKRPALPKAGNPSIKILVYTNPPRGLPSGKPLITMPPLLPCELLANTPGVKVTASAKLSGLIDFNTLLLIMSTACVASIFRVGCRPAVTLTSFN